jgi:hypothetical protein
VTDLEDPAETDEREAAAIAAFARELEQVGGEVGPCWKRSEGADLREGGR